SNIGPDYLLAEDSLKSSVSLQKMRADLGVFLPTFRNQLIANNFHANFIESNGEVLRLTDQVWFGGATTIRGFREAQFFAKRVFWLNSEYRFLLGPDTRLFVFTDNGYFERESPDNLQKWLTSYGMGLRLTAPLGVMQIDFGLERGAPFREGKLHIRLINDF
ncbi:MAG: BamA/TamA family outer membrane protein, partial [Calditrichaeota bacterium]|nr:BamA/TamA family outer membrane protein [Calditrichota bacterium]